MFFSFRAALQVAPAPCSHGLSFPAALQVAPVPCSHAFPFRRRAAGYSRALLPYLFSLPAALQVAPAPCFHASPCAHVFPCSAAPRVSSPTPPWTGVTGVTTWKDSRAGWGCRKSVFFSFRAALQVDPAPCSHGLSFPGSAPSLSARLPPYPCSRYHPYFGSQKGKRKDRTPESLTSPKSSDSPNQ